LFAHGSSGGIAGMTKLLLALCLLTAACGSNPAAPNALHIPPPVVFKPCCSSDSLPKHWKP
jgi:hypothetical protein